VHAETEGATLKTHNPEYAVGEGLNTIPVPEIGPVLVTGASGYVGGRLVSALIQRGYQVRVLVRGDRTDLSERWPGVSLFEGNAVHEQSLIPALQGVHTAFYLIHSYLPVRRGSQESDLAAARTFREVAEKAGVKRIIYLGALADCMQTGSKSIASRQEIECELENGSIPVTTLRATKIIGSGSASFEVLHALVRKLKILWVPGWALKRIQPIAILDVIRYLVGALECDKTSGNPYDLSGPEDLSYKKMMEVLAGILEKKPRFVSAPINSISFFAFWASLRTPVPRPITASLMGGMRAEIAVRGKDIDKLVPIEKTTFSDACKMALDSESIDDVQTRWSDAYPPSPQSALKLSQLGTQPRFIDTHSIVSEKSPADLFHYVCLLGGRTGWFKSNWMWKTRGVVDRMFDGVGLSRGRKSDSRLVVNDVLDFWRVEDLVQDRRLLLRAEMLVPGKAWLEFHIHEVSEGSRLTVIAYFQPDNIWGTIYWYFMLPFHDMIFKDLMQQIIRRA